jgi:hypothetical protein
MLARGFFFAKTLLTASGFPAAHLSADVVPMANRQRNRVEYGQQPARCIPQARRVAPRMMTYETAPAPNGQTERVTRAGAKAMGLTYYWTGKACVKGHLTWRKVNGWTCAACARLGQRVENMTKEQVDRQREQGRRRSGNRGGRRG